MIVYWLLLILTALIAYIFGSLDTMVLSSNFVFHRNLRRLGRGSLWLSNFKRVYGIGGFIRILLVELVKDLVPILLGGLLLGIRGHGDVGRLFAAFVLVLGRCYPLFYGFRSNNIFMTVIVAASFYSISLGIVAAVIMGAVVYVSRYVPLAVAAGSAVFGVLAAVLLDESLFIRLAMITAGVAVIRCLPGVVRSLRGLEPRLSFEKDITYKLDE